MTNESGWKPGDVLKKLLTLERSRGVYRQKPATDEAIRKMQADAKAKLGLEVPDSYVALLRTTNGLQIQTTYFKSADKLVDENLDLELPASCEGIIVLGNDGNMVQQAFDWRDNCFCEIGFYDPDERHNSFESFEGMLLRVLKLNGIL